jgi:molybdenum cofactor cytidylyltransferase
MTSASHSSEFKPGVVILAAGFSTRMGRPKLLLPWDGTTVLGGLLAQWRTAGATQIAVVCAENNVAIHEELDRQKLSANQRILNPRPEDGMFSSIRCAVAWAGWRPDLTHWAIALGDQPHLRPTTLRALLEFAASHPGNVCQPTHSGRPRHPVILPRNAFAELKATSSAHLKEFLQTRPSEALLCRVDDPGLDFDLDEPADYERVLRLFGGGVRPSL